MLVRDFGLSAILFPVDPFPVLVFRSFHCSKHIHLLKLTCAPYAGWFSSPSPRRGARNATGPRDGSGARGEAPFASSTLTTTNVIVYLARASGASAIACATEAICFRPRLYRVRRVAQFPGLVPSPRFGDHLVLLFLLVPL